MSLVMLLVTSGEVHAQGSTTTTAMLRGPASWGSSGEGAPLGSMQVLVIVGVIVLLALLAGVVAWRVRRTPRDK